MKNINNWICVAENQDQPWYPFFRASQNTASRLVLLSSGDQPRLIKPQTRIPPKSDQEVITLVPCPCPFTTQYDPVCASDNQTYSNIAILNCWQQCGYSKFTFGCWFIFIKKYALNFCQKNYCYLHIYFSKIKLLLSFKTCM